MSRCLQLDVGNSSAKWRLVEGTEVLIRGRYVPGDEGSRGDLLACADAIDALWVSSVAGDGRETELVTLLQSRWGVAPWLPKAQARTGRLVSSYAQPERMGVDRWLAMVAGSQRCDGRFVVVDAGSALTIDVVTATGEHDGGYIIPGPHLMERALLLDTDRVRFDEDLTFSLEPGRSTMEAVGHGIALAQAGAVMLALQKLGREPHAVFLTGGGGGPLMDFLDTPVEYLPDLVFEGLEAMAEADGID